MTSPGIAFGLLAGATAIAVAMRLGAERSEWIRDRIRVMYTTDSPIWLRNAVPLLPLTAPSAFLLSSMAILPRELAVWVIAPAFVLLELSFVLAYQAPAPLTPRWLRRDIARGSVPLARPDKLDWLLFWIVVPIILIADATYTILQAPFIR